MLVVNPNTSGAVTDLLLRHARAMAGAGVRVRACTARFGTPYITDEASYAVAGHAALDAWAAALAQPGPRPDAVLIGCFGDPGLLALRNSSNVPVTGLAEAAFHVAARHGRFAIVTGGPCWGPILQRLAHATGHAQALTAIHTLPWSGAELARDGAGARELLRKACMDVLEQTDAQAIIVGGAGLAGIAADLQPTMTTPLVDSVSAGVNWALRANSEAAVRGQPGFDVPWINLSPEMTALGHAGSGTHHQPPT